MVGVERGSVDVPDRLESLLKSARASNGVEQRQALSAVRAGLFGKRSQPVTLSRYVLARRIGAGGTGLVYEGYDPELDRKVAIKLLKGLASTEAQTRLMREAQATARLAHPNVVSVFDVGTYELDEREATLLGGVDEEAPTRGLFIVMELLPGELLADWLQAEPRSWKKVVELLVGAGRGLAAAHRQGIVHRDFKPSNVIIGDDGRPRVFDFGPAIAGTPAFMAPEQHRGETPDARSDQFAFCVSLYAGLFGQRPFEGTALAELREAKDARRIRPLPPDVRVPGRIVRAVLRGLDPDPDARFPSMDALLAELEHDPWRWRRRVIVGGCVVLAGGLGFAVRPSSRAELAVCDEARRELDGVWDQSVREALEAAFVRTEKAFAPEAWSRVGTALDAYTQDWIERREQACRARIDNSDPENEAVLTRRILCLERRRHDVTELVRVLSSADVQVVQRAVDAVNALPPLAGCSDDEALATGLPVHPEGPEQVQNIDRLLARAGALRAAGKFEEGLADAKSAVEQAGRIGHAGFEARARLELGLIHTGRTDYEAAEEEFFAAWQAAERGGAHSTATQALIRLVPVTGYSLAKHELAARLATTAEAKLQYLGHDPAMAGDLARAKGLLALGRVDHAAAAAHLDEALELYARAHGEESATYGATLNALGAALLAGGDVTRARPVLERARALLAVALGDHHPAVTQPMLNLATATAFEGEHAEAVRLHQEVLKIYEEALGRDHLRVGEALQNLGIAQRLIGDYEASLASATEAMEIKLRTYGADHPEHATDLNNIGAVLLEQGRLAEARSHFERALAIVDKRLSPTHAARVQILANVGLVDVFEHRPEEALGWFERARAVVEAHENPPVDELMHALWGTGLAHLALGRPAQAVAPLEQSLAIAERKGKVPVYMARRRFALARALERSDPARARALAEDADAILASGSPLDDPVALRAWLDAHPRPQ